MTANKQNLQCDEPSTNLSLYQPRLSRIRGKYMKFCGLQKISLIDYPNKVASVLFTPGCNLRCGFCHNWRIAIDPRPPFLHEAQALEILEKRKRYVDAVV